MKAVMIRALSLAVVFQLSLLVSDSRGQQVQPRLGDSRTSAVAPAVATVAAVPARFLIGVGDVLTVTFWREQNLSGDVVVRPDGKISLPLLNDVQAIGLTPEQLAHDLAAAAVKFVDEPDVAVMVKEIHSRRVFLLGQVATPGMVQLTGDMNVLQLLAVGGGLLEYADRKNIIITRAESHQVKRFKFNYNDVLKGKNLKQNIILAPGDTVVVP